MAPRLALVDLLNSTERLTPHNIENAIRTLAEDSTELTRLSDGEPENLEGIIVASNPQLSQIFRRIVEAGAHLLSSNQKKRIGRQILQLLVQCLPFVDRHLDNLAALQLILPAITLGLRSREPILVRLGSQDTFHARLLKLMCRSEQGGRLLSSWSNNSDLLPCTELQLARWCSITVDVVSACPPNQHGMHDTVQRWKVIQATKQRLENIKEGADARQETQNLQHAHYMRTKSASLVALGEGQKKTGGSSEARPNILGPWDSELEDLLNVFSMKYPSSTRMLDTQLEGLSGKETLHVLCMLLKTFPCKTCCNTVGTEPSLRHPEPSSANYAGPETKLSMDIFGESVGSWPVLFSSRFKRNLDSIDEKVQHASVIDSLEKISELNATQSLAASKGTLGLRVPLAKTFCPPSLHILWQIDIGISGDKNILEQVIKIWDILSHDDIPKAVQRVADLQKSYNSQVVRLCSRKSAGARTLPLYFNVSELGGYNTSTAAELQDQGQNIEDLDEETVELATKFHRLTKAALRVLKERDLRAEIPLDLSLEQINVIDDFGSASITLGRSGTGKTTCLVYKMVARSLSELQNQRRTRQVLLTASPILAEKLSTHTRELIRHHSSTSQTPLIDDAEGSVDEGVEALGPLDILSLGPEDFPCVCTFGRLLELIFATHRTLDRQNFNARVLDPDDRVDATAFRLDYWPCLPEDVQKLSATLVFSEILGVIKGSTQSSISLVPLTRQEYLSISPRLAPTFVLEQERERIYRCYEHYERLKSERQGYDDVDCVVQLLRILREDVQFLHVVQDHIQEIYVDEIQDQRTIDVALFLTLVKDPRYLHFAGDTAQAISQDSTFRFNDVKDLFFGTLPMPGSSLLQTYSLSQNYRSHQGILRLASLIIELIWNGWPEMMDRLRPEIGHFSGPRPVLFLECDLRILGATGVGFVGLSAGPSNNFGADQVILVRSAATKAALNKSLGDAALVLTIRESKGMEFEDVILWDFFSSCPNTRGVRHLKNLVSKQETTKYAYEHIDMCSELKSFYVAITRARVQFFMFESYRAGLEPMMELLTQDGYLVDITSEGDPDFETHKKKLHPARSADPQRWQARGEICLQNQQWEDAEKCFRRAGNKKRQKLARARLDEEQGRAFQAQSMTSAANDKFEEALALYSELNMTKDTVAILVRLNRPFEAANLWTKSGRHLLAAPLYQKGGFLKEAANAYEKAHEYELAIAILQDGRYYDEIVQFISKNGKVMKPANLLRCIKRCKIFLKRGHISPACRRAAISLLGSESEQETFFRDFDMTDDLLECYHKQHKYVDIFQLRIQKQQWDQALLLALHHGDILISAAEIGQSSMVRLVDLIAIQQFALLLSRSSQESIAGNMLRQRTTDLPKVLADRLRQWAGVLESIAFSHDRIKAVLEVMDGNPMKTLCVLLIMLYTDVVESYTSLDRVSFQLFENLTMFAQSITSQSNSSEQGILESVLGYWPASLNSDNRFVKLSWSPVPDALSESRAVNEEAVRQHFLQRYAAVMLRFFGHRPWQMDPVKQIIETKDKGKETEPLTIQHTSSNARRLYETKWPPVCVAFLTRGRCPKLQTGECRFEHKNISKGDFQTSLEDLLQVTGQVCEIRTIFQKHVLPTPFQDQFLPMRRFWLENLISKLTFVSAFEQDPEAIVGRLEDKNGLRPSILINLEELLFHRLSREWRDRSTFAGILEQIQLPESLGVQVEKRILRSLYHRLGFDPQPDQRWMEAKVSQRLKDAARSLHYKGLWSQVADFSSMMKCQTPARLASIQSIVQLAECVATFLILSLPGSASVLPEHWKLGFNQWLKQFRKQPTGVLTLEERQDSIQSLYMLADAFSTLLGVLARSPSPIKFAIQSRNAEFIAVIFANLAVSQMNSAQFIRSFAHAAGTLDSFARVPDLRMDERNPKGLAFGLIKAFEKYKGKDRLLTVLKLGDAHIHAFSQLRTTMTLKLRDVWPRSEAIDKGSAPNGHQKDQDPANEDELQYTEGMYNAIVRIQKKWRARLPLLKKRREYLATQEAQTIQKYIDLGNGRTKPIQFRALLVEEAPKLTRFYQAQRQRSDNFHGEVMQALDVLGLDQGHDQDQDEIEHLVGQAFELRSKVEQVEAVIADSNLKKMVMGRDVGAIEVILGSARASLKEVKETLTHSERAFAKLVKERETIVAPKGELEVSAETGTGYQDLVRAQFSE